MGGFSTVTGDPIGCVVTADNVSFDGTRRGGALTTNGQLLVGSTVLPHIRVGTITSPLGTVSIGYSSPNITIDVTGGANPIEKVNVDTTTGAGTNPVLPAAGAITVTGGQYATGTFGTRVITINSAAANSYTVEAQISSAVVASLSTKNGLSHYDNTLFTVDANGFVSATGTGFVKTLTGNSGGAIPPTANNINIQTSNSTVKFAGAGSTLTQNFDPTNLLMGNAGASITTATHVVGVGHTAAGAVTSGGDTTALGYLAGSSFNTGAQNTALGSLALQSSTTQANNVAVGYFCMNNCTTGTGQNVGVGASVLSNLLTGANNTVIGQGSGGGYVGAESNNIIIGQNIGGTAAESNVIRIGNSSATSCFITGIDGVNVGSVAKVVTETSNQLGTATITAGNGVTVTPSANTITIAATANFLTVTTVNHAASPYTVLSTDQFLAVDVTGGVVTIKLPNAPTTGRVIIIKDSKGSASTSNITITTVGGAVTIDGATSQILASNFSSVQLLFDGTSYEIF